MNLQLKGLHVLITGGSKRIGLACAEGFVREGARISLVARGREALQKTQQHLQSPRAETAEIVGIFAADLQNAASAEQALAAAQALNRPIDVLVNCAGAARPRPLTN